MSKREITVLTDVCLITCIVQRDVADDIIHAAREAGAQGATVHFARGHPIFHCRLFPFKTKIWRRGWGSNPRYRRRYT